ncbi:MAG: type II toxin-antitoxin system VapC family toxin [Firmicutes bacterium]|jgi:predicted nucleic-acid-binding protein|nr:type II toxin-antitoxin system VapC family toxin [Candidatus Fermentithermobacillaceae bacterium]
MRSRVGWLDTNVVLRYLLDDCPEHSPRARILVEKAEKGEITLYVPTYIICETVYVLESQAYTRSQISEALSRFLAISGISVDNSPLLQLCLRQYRNSSVDFCDLLLYAQCADNGDTVFTFNKRHFQRLGTDWKEP